MDYKITVEFTQKDLRQTVKALEDARTVHANLSRMWKDVAEHAVGEDLAAAETHARNEAEEAEACDILAYYLDRAYWDGHI